MRCRDLLLLAPLLVAGCGDDAAGPAATAETARLAAVDAAHLCQVQGTTFRTEAEIGTTLEELLAAEGLEFQDWRAWRDSLPDAPERAAQLAEATSRGC